MKVLNDTSLLSLFSAHSILSRPSSNRSEVPNFLHALTMSSTHSARRSHNERVAREKALHTHVYISGLKGHHTLEVGLAYYYCGHYIYAYTAGNLIEPIPYSTRKGITIQGLVSASAPTYDAEGRGLKSEDSIRALEVSIKSEKKAREQSEEAAAAAAVESAEAPTTCSRPVSPSLHLPRAAEDLPPPLTSLAALRETALKTFTPLHGKSFLAASAPGSRLASRAASPSGVRPVSSHIGIARLGSIAGKDSFPVPSPSPASNMTSTEDAPTSACKVGYLYGLGDHALSAEHLPRLGTVGGSVRVPPCPLHGEECDGVTVTMPWLTKRKLDGEGFVGEPPMIERAGREMVDWAGLVEKERAAVQG